MVNEADDNSVHGENGSRPPTAHLHAHLERFVIENDDLLALEARIGRFNIFDALGIAAKEIQHSNFLAFILDPAESHGLGQLFLKAVLMDLLKSTPAELRPLSPIDLDGNDLRGVTVKREWMHIDLLITCQDPPFAVIIENKVGSKEHSDQLRRYERTVKDLYAQYRCLRVLLSPDGDTPSEQSWVPYSYGDIHRVLQRVRKTNQTAIGDDVLTFLDQYLTLLETRLMDDKSLDELCRKIYKAHRQALDLIWDRVGSPGAAKFMQFADAVEQDDRWHSFSRSGKYIDFMPKTWLQWLPPIGQQQNPQYWIFAHLKLRDDSLVCILFVGPMLNGEFRTNAIKELRGVAPSLGFKASASGSTESKWARISTPQPIARIDDEEESPSTLMPKFQKELDALYVRLENLASTLRQLCSVPAKAGS